MEEIYERIDFLEINGRSLKPFNNRAIEFSQKHKIPLVGGSDAHTYGEIGCVYTRMDDFNVVEVIDNTSLLHPIIPMLRTRMYKMVGI